MMSPLLVGLIVSTTCLVGVVDGLIVGTTHKKLVVVAGSTGKTGRLVVSKLIESSPNVTVRAFVRDTTKAEEVLAPSPQVEVFKGDLGSSADITKACQGAEGVVWCATGFSDTGSVLNKIRSLIGIAVRPSQSIDVVGVEAFARALAQDETSDRSAAAAPRVVMLSSAGVTRPAWDKAKKEQLCGAADIPIVRLNPFGILEKKCEAEQRLRDSGVPYCVVRPCGLNDDWPEGRPILSQGDVAVGRTNRADVASVLAACVFEPAAAGKTFEMFTLQGYPPPRSLAPALGRLLRDRAKPDLSTGASGVDTWAGPLPLDERSVEAEYGVLQQLLPGEVQDPTALEMGRTYEQVDRGEVAARSKGAEATDREVDLASSVR